jgi:uncharacterized protein (TIGR03435 family)
MTATPPFGFRCPLISGSIPEWVKTDRWEIQGKIAANALPDYSPRQLRSQETPELNLMLQALLEDRFRLKTHWTTKELPAYALTIDKKGAKLKPSSAAKDADKADGRDVHGMSGIETDPMPDGSRRTRLTFQASSMGELAKTLSIYFDRQVVDRTGLNGEFDFTLEYEEDSDAKIAFNPFSGLTPSTLSDVLRSIGLGLESTKARREVLVIDHVEKPSSN